MFQRNKYILAVRILTRPNGTSLSKKFPQITDTCNEDAHTVRIFWPWAFLETGNIDFLPDYMHMRSRPIKPLTTPRNFVFEETSLQHNVRWLYDQSVTAAS
jgi:hypothetical protein